MLRSESLKELIPALVQARKLFKHAKKDSVNPHFKSKFADYESVVDACEDGLSKNGLVFTHGTDRTEHGDVLETILYHVSGEFIGCIMPIINGPNSTQGYGSGLSYAKRYSLQSLLGIPSGDDDDGENAMARPQQKAPENFDQRVEERREAFLKDNHIHKYSAATHKCFIGVADGHGKFKECGAIELKT